MLNVYDRSSKSYANASFEDIFERYHHWLADKSSISSPMNADTEKKS